MRLIDAGAFGKVLSDWCSREFEYYKATYGATSKVVSDTLRKVINMLADQSALDYAPVRGEWEWDTLEAKLKQAERERDAAVDDLKQAAKDGSVCTGCMHNAGLDAVCEAADYDCKVCYEPCKCKNCDDNSNYEWRGICEENTNGDSNA